MCVFSLKPFQLSAGLQNYYVSGFYPLCTIFVSCRLFLMAVLLYTLNINQKAMSKIFR